MQKQFTYKDSGVDVKAGEELVQSIKGIVKETHNINVLSNIGGFGGLFRPDFKNMKDPVLVSSVDGVGTKLIVAFKKGQYDTVGQDLVNHCVNDIAVCGAEPMFFLDYFSTGKLDQQIAFDVIKGFTIACKENGCALIGGETAEMPDIYNDGEFDLAGTIVGVVDRDAIVDGSKVQRGDLLFGVPSTGLHTNGYSLARKVLFSKYDVDDRPQELNGESVGEALLKVHRSYLSVIRGLKSFPGVHAFSHITGGGIEGNTRRVLNGDLKLDVDYSSWDRNPIFNLIQQIGNVPEEDMRLSMNLGIGLVIIASAEAKDDIMKWATAQKETILEIGKVI
ncbi:MAG TPA: phosphoribosylformylglycinamidine cyclo-ligase [Bacteroidetes bacterium]|nr:phosphoribosylformylglycinamidine cyclo-ligase [Bacteroidota bacterium]